MKVSAGQLNNRYNVPKKITKVGIEGLPSKYKNNKISFGGDLPKIIMRKVHNSITIENGAKLISKFDELFGKGVEKGYFSEMIEKSGADILNDGSLSIKNRNFFVDDLGKTIISPFSEIIPGILNAGAKFFKIPIKENSILDKINKFNEKEAARYFVLDAFEEFANRKYGNILDEEKCMAKFEDWVAQGVKSQKKNYSSRDERTLNRAVTSFVSALYSASDFHNISMLEKDDKQDAKVAAKGRFKQETTRLAFNSITTYISLGMLDRHTRRSLPLNSLVIAGSALISEVGSRLLSNTPLRTLSPEAAAKLAKQRTQKLENKESKESKENKENKENNENISFKSNLKSTNEIFKNFTSEDGSFAALNSQKQQITNEKTLQQTIEQPNKKPKKLGISKILALAFGGATLYYFAMRILKGDYKAIKAQKEFLSNYSDIDINNFAKQNLVGNTGARTEFFAKMKSQATKIIDEHKARSKKFTPISRLLDFLTKKETEIDLNILSEKINELLKTKEGAEIAGLLKEYNEHIGVTKLARGIVDNKYTQGTKRFIAADFINGFLKIFRTFFDILTMPARFVVEPIINKTLTQNTSVESNFAKVVRSINKNGRYKEELAELYGIITNSKSNEEIVNRIKRRTRNIQIAIETGELANTSRTMVTAIGTYFFVNDYRNKVLIESEGKNIEGAREETVERIWHKVFNFVFNGTLMNIFNTVFAKIVNGNLLGAAVVASVTEFTNEALIRKSLCQPILPRDSKQEIIDFEQEQVAKDGFWGAWSRIFKKITGKKSLTEKAGIKMEKPALQNKELNAHQG